MHREPNVKRLPTVYINQTRKRSTDFNKIPHTTLNKIDRVGGELFHVGRHEKAKPLLEMFCKLV